MDNEQTTRNKRIDCPTFFSALGITLGFSAFVTFFILENYDAAIWAFASCKLYLYTYFF